MPGGRARCGSASARRSASRAPGGPAPRRALREAAEERRRRGVVAAAPLLGRAR
jgi:hypothetical protein